MTKWQDSMRKREAVKIAEAHGIVADSMEVRSQLITRHHRGELTLEEVQAEIKRLKRNAKKNGKMTRDQVWRKG